MCESGAVRWCVTLGLLAVLGGCAAAARAPEPRWSTRDMSVLGRLSAEPPLEVDPHVLDEATASSLRPAALAVLDQAVRSGSPLLRANAIEALHRAPGHVEGAVARGLADESRGVRFVAAMTVGRLELARLALLLEPLLDDPSDSVRAAAIYGMHRNGLEVDLNPLATMIRSADPEVRANAAMVLGELGDPSALGLLRQALGLPMPRVPTARARLVDMQIAEAMVRLGDERQIEGIRAALFLPPEHGELTAIACQMSGRLQDGRVTTNLLDMAARTGRTQESAEVRLAATAALATLDPARAPIGVPLGYASSDLFTLRAQAALTLGALRRREGLSALAVLLHDADPVVQVAAAAAILEILPG